MKWKNSLIEIRILWKILNFTCPSKSHELCFLIDDLVLQVKEEKRKKRAFNENTEEDILLTTDDDVCRLYTIRFYPNENIVPNFENQLQKLSFKNINYFV